LLLEKGKKKTVGAENDSGASAQKEWRRIKFFYRVWVEIYPGRLAEGRAHMNSCEIKGREAGGGGKSNSKNFAERGI